MFLIANGCRGLSSEFFAQVRHAVYRRRPIADRSRRVPTTTVANHSGPTCAKFSTLVRNGVWIKTWIHLKLFVFSSVSRQNLAPLSFYPDNVSVVQSQRSGRCAAYSTTCVFRYHYRDKSFINSDSVTRPTIVVRWWLCNTTRTFRKGVTEHDARRVPPRSTTYYNYYGPSALRRRSTGGPSR